MIGISGVFTAIVDGKVVVKSNLIVQTALVGIAHAIATTYDFGLNAIALGTGTTPPSLNDTGLEHQELAVPASVTVEESTVKVATDTIIWQHPDTDFTESGLFGNALFSRTVFNPMPIAPGQTVKLTWDIKIQNFGSPGALIHGVGRCLR
jgi:hypothetical protein